MNQIENLALKIESLLFCAAKPLSVKLIKNLVDEPQDANAQAGDLQTQPSENSTEAIQQAIKELIQKYNQPNFSFEIVAVNQGYVFRTKPAFSFLVGRLFKETKTKLSKAALEILAIVAYNQPVEREKIESIRGVDSGATIRSLLEKKIIKISGRSSTPGQPLLYATDEKFFELFGLNSLKDLPKAEELEEDEEMASLIDSQNQNQWEELKTGPKVNLDQNQKEDQDALLAELDQSLTTLKKTQAKYEQAKEPGDENTELAKEKDAPVL